MPGIADVEPRGVSAGLAAQPLVTPAAPVAGPEAVAQLVDSFRKGVITADDIHNRIGELHQTQEQAGIQQAKEFVSPEAQAARLATLAAATGRGNLEAAQASAGQPLVQPQAEVQAEQIRKTKAEQLYGSGIQAFQQYGPLFGAPASILDGTGKPDYDAMGAEGNHILSVLSQRQYAQQMLIPEGTPTTITTQHGTYVKKLNKAGEDITEGSPSWNYYRGILAQPLQTKMVPNAAPGASPAAAPRQPATAQPAAPAATPAATPVTGMQPGELVEPKTVGEARAQLINAGMPIQQAVQMDANEVLNAHRQKFARPEITPSGPVGTPPSIPVEPKSAMAAPPEIGVYEPGTGMKVAAGKEQFTSDKIMEDLHKQKSYELWDQQKGFAHSFETTAQKINQVPVEQQRSGKVPMNALDIALAESIIKMYDPGMAIREFKWDKLAEAQPYLEKLPNWKSEFLHTGALTPEGRQRLVEMGYDNINGKDAAVKPQIEMAARRAQSSGLQPADVLNEDELRVLQGKAFGTQKSGLTKPESQATSNKTGPVVNIPGIGQVYLGGDGQYHRAQ